MVAPGGKTGLFPFGTAPGRLAFCSSLLLMDRLIYLLALGVVSFIRLLPITVCFVLGQLIGLVIWTILPGYRRLAKRNLRIAFGSGKEGLCDREAAALVRRHFANLGANLLCSVKIPALSEKKLRSRLRFDKEQAWEDWIVGKKAGERGTVAALSHFGNWEINAQIAEFVKPRRAGCVYQAIRNPLMDDLVNRDRRSRGVATFDRKKEMKGAAAMLKKGGVVGVLIDQHAGGAGIWMPLFGKLASTSPLAASLAQRTGALIAMVSVRTIGLARWEIHTSNPVPTEGRDPAEITMDLNHLLEAEIRHSPSDWFWVHNRWKSFVPDFLLQQIKRGIHLPEGTDPAKLHPYRLLVRSPNWLGDACMAVPAIQAMKLGRPDLHITILTPAKLADLWREISEVSAVVSIPTGASPRKVAALIKKSGIYDTALLLPNSWRSALEVRLAGIRMRLGLETHRAKSQLTRIIPMPRRLHPVMHQGEALLSMVKRLGGPETAFPVERPRPVPKGPIRIALCPGAEYGPAKRWPLERYRAVMEKVSATQDLTWVIVGTAKESVLGDKLAKNFDGNVENLCGKTTLPELIAELKRCHLLLTNDTGTMHLADVLGVPVVAIFGSTEPALTGPTGTTFPPHKVIRKKVECSPCYLRTCPIDFRCMKEISVEMVTQAVTESLNEFTGIKGMKGMGQASETIIR
jgi:heptosyltransferase II